MSRIIRLNNLPDGNDDLSDDDIIVMMDDPSGNKITKKLSISQLKEFIGSGSSGGGNIVSVNGKTGTVVLTKDDIGLSNVDNTSDLNKPISNDMQIALNAKASINSPSFTGTVTGISKGMIGLGNVDNTSDLDKPISNPTQNALNNKSNIDHNHEIEDVAGLQAALNSKQASGSYAVLVDGKVPPTQLPSYVDEILEYANSTSFPNPGASSTIYLDLSTNKIYRWSGSTYIEINSGSGTTDTLLEGSVNLYFTDARASAASPVQSVAGKTGAVLLNKDDVGLNNVNNTSDANKPISTAVQNALDTKASLNNPSFTGTVSGITKSMIGLSNVDNTSDINKPISSSTQTALNLKANIADISAIAPSICSGRLTVVDGNPTPNALNTGAFTSQFLYYTPYNGRAIGLYDPSSNTWRIHTFDQLVLNLSGLAANTNFDIFLYDNNGVLTLKAEPWANNTTRLVSLTTINGVYVRSVGSGLNSTNQRYLGTVRTTSTGTVEDGVSRRFVWNVNNQISIRVSFSVGVNHTYSSSAWRPVNNDTSATGQNGSGRAELVIGINDKPYAIGLRGELTNGNIGIGVNTTTGPGYGIYLGSSTLIRAGIITNAHIAEGYNYFQLLQSTTSGTGTYVSVVGLMHLIC